MTFTLLDVWVLDPTIWAQLNLASWIPVDMEPVGVPVRDFIRTSSAIPIAMSQFGERMLRDEDFEPLYVPHGIDTEKFKRRDRHAARKRMNLPQDSFVIGMVAANKGRPSRKSFQQSMEAFRIFSERHDDALLYLHTVASSNHSNGVELPALIDALGIGDKDEMSRPVPDDLQPVPARLIGQVYSAMDVLLGPSQGEGFGIPLIEAQACGVPVIVWDFSSQPELFGAGWAVHHRPPLHDPGELAGSARCG